MYGERAGERVTLGTGMSGKQDLDVPVCQAAEAMLQSELDQPRQRGNLTPPYPKRWKNLIRDACGEMGFKDVHFVPEPLAQINLAETLPEGHFVLFSWQEGGMFLSLFYHGLLYDSFAMKASSDAPEAILKEFRDAQNNFENSLNQKIYGVCIG